MSLEGIFVQSMATILTMSRHPVHGHNLEGL